MEDQTPVSEMYLDSRTDEQREADAAIKVDFTTVVSKVKHTPWGDYKYAELDIEADTATPVVYAATKTEEELAAEKARVEKLEADQKTMDAWIEKYTARNEDDTFMASAEDMAKDFNAIAHSNNVKKTMSAWDAVKFRAKYGRPAVACHTKGKTYRAGGQKYVVDSRGSWRKVS